MTTKSKITTGILGLIILIPGLAKFTEPFKTFIYEHLYIIGLPYPEILQHIVKLSEIGVGMVLIYLALKSNTLTLKLRNGLFYVSNLAVLIMMFVALYVHLHPDVPADVLPLEIKPPYMPIGYILLVIINVYFNSKQNINQ